MHSTEWGFLVAAYLFLGGLSAGLFFVSAVLTGLRREDGASRLGALLVPWPVMFGSFLLVLDLGVWYRFFKLFLHVNWLSPMSLGSWLLMAFILLSLAYAYAWVPGEMREAFFKRLPKCLRFLRTLNRDLSLYRRPLALAGLPLSLAVAGYTGVLLGALQARPFWNTNLLAQLFLLSSLSTGCALLMLLSRARHGRDLGFLYALDGALLALELAVVVLFVAHGRLSLAPVREAVGLVLGGRFTLLFWVLFVGMGVIAPLILALREAAGRVKAHSARLTLTAASLVLTGGFVARCLFVFAGQASSIRPGH